MSALYDQDAPYFYFSITGDCDVTAPTFIYGQAAATPGASLMSSSGAKMAGTLSMGLAKVYPPDEGNYWVLPKNEGNYFEVKGSADFGSVEKSSLTLRTRLPTPALVAARPHPQVIIGLTRNSIRTSTPQNAPCRPKTANFMTASATGTGSSPVTGVARESGPTLYPCKGRPAASASLMRFATSET